MNVNIVGLKTSYFLSQLYSTVNISKPLSPALTFLWKRSIYRTYVWKGWRNLQVGQEGWNMVRVELRTADVLVPIDLCSFSLQLCTNLADLKSVLFVFLHAVICPLVMRFKTSLADNELTVGKLEFFSFFV